MTLVGWCQTHIWGFFTFCGNLFTTPSRLWTLVIRILRPNVHGTSDHHGGTRAPPTQSCAFPVKGAGGALRARPQEHGHPRPPPCPTSPSPRALWLQLLRPTADRHAHHPHPLIYYFLTGLHNFQILTKQVMSTRGSGRPPLPSTTQSTCGCPGAGSLRAQHAAFRPSCSPALHHGFPGPGRPQVPCSSGSQHRGRLREFRPQCRAHRQRLSWAAIPRLSREHFPTVDTHGGLRGLVETGTKSLHCMSDVFPMQPPWAWNRNTCSENEQSH